MPDCDVLQLSLCVSTSWTARRVKDRTDLIESKKEFGDRLAFVGGIDVRAIAGPDPSGIQEEIKSRRAFAKRGQDYIHHSNH